MENRKRFLKQCVGAEINQRSRDGNDNHVCVNLLIEDDETWHSTNFDISSYWLPELIEVLKEVQEHLEKNCEPDVYENGIFGFRFKNKNPKETK